MLKQWAASGLIEPEAAYGRHCPVRQECRRIEEAWSGAAFSGTSDDGLRRYFNRHLLDLIDLANQFDLCPETNNCLSAATLELIDHLRHYYGPYLDGGAIAPRAYQKRFTEKITYAANSLKERLLLSAVPPGLKACLLAFLEEMDVGATGQQFTFNSFYYFQNWLHRLSALDPEGERSEADLHSVLELMDFNDLAYLNFRQNEFTNCTLPLQERIEYLQKEKARLASLPLTKGLCCRPEWPSLSRLLSGWITEELSFLISRVQASGMETVYPAEKYPLDLSVAHLGCLLKVFCDGGQPGNRNLTRLFHFVTTHFSTKKQENISARSLSKAYYGTTQVTAAKVQGMLQQMISGINRKYFPLIAGLAAGAAHCFFPGR